jgi:hypothetical protein
MQNNGNSEDEYCKYISRNFNILNVKLFGVSFSQLIVDTLML